jgi:hypothetical protein
VLAAEEVEERPFHLRALAGVEPEAVAAELRAALVVDEPEARRERDVILRLGERGLLAPRAHDAIVLLPARGHAVVGKVRERGHPIVEIRVEPAELDLHRGDLVAQRRGLGLDRRRVAAGPLRFADPLGDLVALARFSSASDWSFRRF